MNIDIQTLEGGAVVVAVVALGAVLLFRNRKKKPAAKVERPLPVSPRRDPDPEAERWAEAAAAEATRQSEAAIAQETTRRLEYERETRDRLAQDLKNATTASACWDILTDDDSEDDLREQAAAKFVEVARRELAQATTSATCLELYEIIDFDQYEDELVRAFDDEAGEKMLVLVRSVDDAIPYLDGHGGDYDADDDELLYTRVARKAITVATTEEELRRVYQVLPSESDIEEECDAKLLTFTNDLSDCGDAIQRAYDEEGSVDFDDPLVRAAVLRAADLIKIEDAEQHELQG